jgi:hypothetical protein
MTDTEKLIVSKLLAAIEVDRWAWQPFTYKLADMEKATAEANARRREAAAALDAAMAAAKAII